MLRQHIQFLLRKSMSLPTQTEKVAPNVTSGTRAQLIVLHADMDPALKGGIDIVDAVGGEKEYAFVVFENTQEDGDEFVAFKIVGGALFEEDVGFVEEEDGVPFCSHFEHIAEGGFNFRG